MTGAVRRAVFLDRDGVLNALVMREGRAVSPRRLGEFRLFPEAATQVRRLRRRGLLVFVVTNQPDVARGHLAAADLAEMHRRLQAALEVDDVAVCPHDDADRCSCRKPQPGMLLGLAKQWRVDLGGSFVVGDTWKDVAAGHRAGCRTILIEETGAGAPLGESERVPDWRVASLREAVKVIESGLATSGGAGAGGIRA